MSTNKARADDRFTWTKEQAEAVTIQKSQCAECENGFGFDGCKVFGTQPDMYVFRSANVDCPKRIPKK